MGNICTLKIKRIFKSFTMLRWEMFHAKKIFLLLCLVLRTKYPEFPYCHVGGDFSKKIEYEGIKALCSGE